MSTQPRTFHPDALAHYILPNDSPEHVRLETQSKFFRTIMNGKLLHAPLDSPRVTHILDVGCGTGVVTDQLAAQFPQAHVYGVDLSPVPVLRTQRDNVTFLQGNGLSQAPQEWIPQPRRSGIPAELSGGGFDLVFSRLLMVGMTDWRAYFAKVIRMLKPDGYVEVHDLDARCYDAQDREVSQGWQYLREAREIGMERGMDFECGTNAPAYMRKAGFDPVDHHPYRLMMGGAGETDPDFRAAGDWWLKDWTEVGEMMVKTSSARKARSWEREKELLEEVRYVFRPDQPGGRYFKFPVTVGRKPA